MAAAAAKSLQSCPTLCNPIDGSPPGSPVPGILQARILEWVIWLQILHGKQKGKMWKQRHILFSWAAKSLQTVTEAIKLKDAWSLEEKL